MGVHYKVDLKGTMGVHTYKVDLKGTMGVHTYKGTMGVHTLCLELLFKEGHGNHHISMLLSGHIPLSYQVRMKSK